ALGGEAAAVEATLLRSRQQADELRATRAAALARLARLSGRSIDADATTPLPDLNTAVAAARTSLDAQRARPEYEQFDRARDRAARARLREGATTAAEYVDRQTEWLAAQFDRARHRVELAASQARLLTTLGLEVR